VPVSLANLIRPLGPRDPHEEHRVASPLELFTDLCFVVAVSQAAAAVHHAISAGQVGDGAVHFGLAFFAVFWAWLNFTWFGSAYDNDDLAYRLLTILQILGSLVLAAGIPRMFEDDFRLAVTGYVVMRVALVTQWLRVARHDPERRITALRYASGVVVVQVGWVCYLAVPHNLGVVVFLVLAACELVVPAWAERPSMTPWHPHHIAERYSLFYIIVLGETILSSTIAIQAALDEGQVAHLVGLIVGGVPLVFSLWWLYFSREDADLLLDRGLAWNMTWGFGHYFVFSSAAAVGAGLAVRVDHYTHHSEASDLLSALSVTLPTAVLVVAIYVFHLVQHDRSRQTIAAFTGCALVVLAGTLTPIPEVVAGLACTALVVATVLNPQNRSPEPTNGPVEHDTGGAVGPATP
jgi:low temperature requirement protein LtrA